MRLFFSLLMLAVFSGPAPAREVTVFAAASLKTVLDDLAEGYEAESGERLRLVYAGSSVLARQISLGAPADLFISANPDWVEWLAERGVVDTPVALVGNALVVVSSAPSETVMLTKEGLGEGRVALALTRAVPAGIYARQALEALGLWEAVRLRVVEAENVRAALALVARDEARFGFVYRSDAVAEPRVDVVAEIPAWSHAPIVYVAAEVIGGDAGAFLKYLSGASVAFKRHGFTPLAEEGE